MVIFGRAFGHIGVSEARARFIGRKPDVKKPSSRSANAAWRLPFFLALSRKPQHKPYVRPNNRVRAEWHYQISSRMWKSNEANPIDAVECCRPLKKPIPTVTP